MSDLDRHREKMDALARRDMSLNGPGDFDPPEPKEPKMMPCGVCKGKGSLAYMDSHFRWQGTPPDEMLDSLATDLRREKHPAESNACEAMSAIVSEWTIETYGNGVALLCRALGKHVITAHSWGGKTWRLDVEEGLIIVAAILESPMADNTCFACRGAGEVEDDRERPEGDEDNA